VDSARLFLAVPLDEAVRDALLDAGRRVKPALPGGRWCGSNALHLTLRFFGTLPLDRVEDIDTAVRLAIEGREAFDLRVQGVGGFPRLEAPRVLWAGVSDGSAPLVELAGTLNAAFGAAGLGMEERAFVPHVTLARFKRRAHLDPAVLEAAVRGAQDHDFGVSPCETLVLYASELTPSGPLYTRVAHWTLGAAK
jgi:2'-5' RNA ligase